MATAGSSYSAEEALIQGCRTGAVRAAASESGFVLTSSFGGEDPGAALEQRFSGGSSAKRGRRQRGAKGGKMGAGGSGAGGAAPVLRCVARAGAGAAHFALLRRDGSALTCGAGAFGRLGHGDERPQPSPLLLDHHLPAPTAAHPVVAVGAGSQHTAFLLAGGCLWVCGSDEHGQLGLGQGGGGGGGGGGGSARLAPAPAAAAGPARAAAVALRRPAGGCVPVPARVCCLPAIRAVACGSLHTLALGAAEQGGAVYSWGCGAHGRLGHGDDADVFTPRPMRSVHLRSSVHHPGREQGRGAEAAGDTAAAAAVGGPADQHARPAAAVAAGAAHSLVLLAGSGAVLSCGLNTDGRLGRAGPFPGPHFLAPVDLRRARLCPRSEGGGDNGGGGGGGFLTMAHLDGLELRATQVAAGGQHSAFVVDCCLAGVPTAPAAAAAGGGATGGESGAESGSDDEEEEGAGAAAAAAAAVVAAVAAVEAAALRVHPKLSETRAAAMAALSGALFTCGAGRGGALGLGDGGGTLRGQPLPSLVVVRAGASGLAEPRAAATAASLHESAAAPQRFDAASALAPFALVADVAGLSARVVAAACGAAHTVALSSTGRAYAFGRGARGALGLGDARDRSWPAEVRVFARKGRGAVRVAHVSCGEQGTLFVTGCGRALGCGAFHPAHGEATATAAAAPGLAVAGGALQPPRAGQALAPHGLLPRALCGRRELWLVDHSGDAVSTAAHAELERQAHALLPGLVPAAPMPKAVQRAAGEDYRKQMSAAHRGVAGGEGGSDGCHPTERNPPERSNLVDQRNLADPLGLDVRFARLAAAATAAATAAVAVEPR